MSIPVPVTLLPEGATEKDGHKESWKPGPVENVHDKVGQQLIGVVHNAAGQRIAALLFIVGKHNQATQTNQCVGEDVEQ